LSVPGSATQAPATAPEPAPTTEPTQPPTSGPAPAPTTPAPAPAPNNTARYYEQDSSAVTYSGSWSPNPMAVHSGGSAKLAMDPGSRATFAFTGTGATWIGYRDEWSGIASVKVDGVLKGTLDTYLASGQAQSTLYSVNGLTNGTHTLTIEATGTHCPASAGSWIWVDAFAVAR
jgi:hypothetical protein